MGTETPSLPIPLRTGADGVIRVAETRVTLLSLVEDYLQGATAEEIAEHFPSVSLADVYASLSYYLRNRPEIDAALTRHRQEAARLRTESEHRHGPWPKLRERLQARETR